MKKVLTYGILLFVCTTAMAQFDLSMSQYMHNRYAINKAFGGSRETLTLFGSFRKKWSGINGSPSGQYFSTHAPLKNEKMALGLELFNQQYGISGHSGFSFSYTYRIKTGKKTQLGFALSGGGNFMSANWASAVTIDDNDGAFAANEKAFNPIVGFGIGLYSNKFFAGLSIPSFITQNEFNLQNTEFDLGKVSYIATAGYLFTTSEKWMLQPSFMALHDGVVSEQVIDANGTVIYDNLIWFGVSYRNTKEVVALVGYQITPQLRFSYSLDYSTGEVGSFNNGTHEVSIQYDIGFKIKTPNPKFF